MPDNGRLYIVKHCLGMVLLFGEHGSNVGVGSTGNKDPDEGKARDVSKELKKLLDPTSLAFIKGVKDDEYHRRIVFSKKLKRLYNEFVQLPAAMRCLKVGWD